MEKFEILIIRFVVLLLGLAAAAVFVFFASLVVDVGLDVVAYCIYPAGSSWAVSGAMLPGVSRTLSWVEAYAVVAMFVLAIAGMGQFAVLMLVDCVTGRRWLRSVDAGEMTATNEDGRTVTLSRENFY